MFGFFAFILKLTFLCNYATFYLGLVEQPKSLHHTPELEGLIAKTFLFYNKTEGEKMD